MKKAHALLLIAGIFFLFTACKKSEGDTIINNYGTGDNIPPKRKLLQEYGLKDSSQVLKFTYQNNEPGKLKELTTYSMGVANGKFVVLYDGANKAIGYQSYTLPANTLSEQGTYKLDNKGRLTEIIKRKTNGDTIGIVTAYYDDLDYQPTATNFYDKTKDRITHYDYMTYDSKGNITKMVSYTDNGTDPLYKSSDVEASGFGKGINPLNQLYYYLVTSLSSSGYGNSGPLYFSNYFANSSRLQNYNANGSNGYVNLSNYNYEVDADNAVTSLTSGSQTIFMKY